MSGKNYEHRKQWLQARLAELAQIFAIDACVFAILSNHFHLLLRNRPDLTAQWSNEEVMRRWWQLCPGRRDDQGRPAEISPSELQALLADPKRIAACRAKLSSISCFMKHLNEWLAKRANREEGLSGHFFEGRFKARSLLDEGAILAAALYIDLNEIRAGLAETLETSRHTSAYQRILLQMRREAEALGMEFGVDQFPADWLCPIDEQSCEVLLGPAGVESVRGSAAMLNAAADTVSQASETSGPVVNRGAIEKRWRHGFLPLTIEEYLTTLDWAARQVIPGKSGAMDASLPPLFERLKLSPTLLIQMVVNFDKWFRTAAGCVQRLVEEAARQSRQWLCGVGAMRSAES